MQLQQFNSNKKKTIMNMIIERKRAYLHCDHEIISELTAKHFFYLSVGQIKIES